MGKGKYWCLNLRFFCIYKYPFNSNLYLKNFIKQSYIGIRQCWSYFLIVDITNFEKTIQCFRKYRNKKNNERFNALATNGIYWLSTMIDLRYKPGIYWLQFSILIEKKPDELKTWSKNIYFLFVDVEKKEREKKKTWFNFLSYCVFVIIFTTTIYQFYVKKTLTKSHCVSEHFFILLLKRLKRHVLNN